MTGYTDTIRLVAVVAATSSAHRPPRAASAQLKEKPEADQEKEAKKL
jgi:hypothetical protein